jgi:hypothetical protein
LLAAVQDGIERDLIAHQGEVVFAITLVAVFGERLNRSGCDLQACARCPAETRSGARRPRPEHRRQANLP